MVKKRIVLIPYWVQDTMQRKKLNLVDCLDFNKVMSVMAISDLVGFSALQEFFPHVLGNVQFYDELYTLWFQSVQANPVAGSYLANNITPFVRLDETKKEVAERLFSSDAKTAQHENAFITYDLSPEVLGVVIYPGFFVREGDVELQKSLVKAILKVLYVYEPSHEVAKTPLFKRYLELLAVK